MTPRKLLFAAQRVVLALRWAFQSPVYLVARDTEATIDWQPLSLECAADVAEEWSMPHVEEEERHSWPASRVNVFAVLPAMAYFGGTRVAYQPPPDDDEDSFVGAAEGMSGGAV